MIKRRFLTLITAVLLLVGSTAAQSDDQSCKFVSGGHPYVTVAQQESYWTYRLSASGPRWTSEPYGYHAPGLLRCESCADRPYTGGLFHFSTFESSEADSKSSHPETSAERITRRSEVFGYPLVSLGPDDLETHAVRDDIEVGPLTGYAVQFQLTERALRKLFPDSFPNEATPFGLLVIHLADACVEFDTTILTVLSEDQSDWMLLSGMLEEIAIEKSVSAGAVLLKLVQ